MGHNAASDEHIPGQKIKPTQRSAINYPKHSIFSKGKFFPKITRKLTPLTKEEVLQKHKKAILPNTQTQIILENNTKTDKR